jgi:hypothetical protein
MELGSTYTSIAGLNILASTGTSHWTLPAGNTSQRPESAVAGMVRYNSQISSFEGYGPGNAWGSLGGVKDVDGDTYILTETSAGSDEDTFSFYNAGTVTATLSGTKLDVKSAVQVEVNNTTDSSSITTGALVVDGGVGIAKKLFVGTDAAVAGNTTLTGTLGVTGTTTLGNLTIGSTKTVSMGSNIVTNVAAPSASTDAANKQYVDEVAQGLKAAPAVEVATTANLTATYSNGTAGVGSTLTATSNGAFPTIDGITVDSTAVGQNGVLVKNQSTAAQNGRYNLTQVGDGSTPWILTRCGVCDQASEIPGSYVFVKAGTTQANTGWVAYVADPDTFVVGTDSITYFQFSGAGTFTAGTGLTLTGTQFSVNASQTQVTAVGTLTTGTWNASVIAGQYGGTGVANTGKTITIGGNFTTSGAHTTTLTTSGNTSVTLPTTGTLATLAGTETLSNKTFTTPVIGAATGTSVVLSAGAQSASLGVGTAASGTTGEIRATNQITSFYSDERLKENITEIDNAIEKVMSLRGVTYNSNQLAESFGYTNKDEQVGVIAQDVEKVLPQVVKAAPFDIISLQEGIEISRSGENYKTVQYEKLVPLLIQAIKEQQVMIEELQKKVGN